MISASSRNFFYGTAPESRPNFSVEGHPGLALDAVPWLHQRDVAALAMDNRTIEVVPWPEESGTEPAYPVHSRLLRDFGMTIGELW